MQFRKISTEAIGRYENHIGLFGLCIAVEAVGDEVLGGVLCMC